MGIRLSANDLDMPKPAIMKNLLGVFILLFFVNGCTKEYQSPEQQLVEVIQSKLANVPEKATFFVLKNDKLCNQLDCEKQKFAIDGATVNIMTREDMFMRGQRVFFEVVSWKQSPEIAVHGGKGQPIVVDPVTGKCRGN